MKRDMTTYDARYEHDGRAWVVQFRDPDIATFGRSLRSAKAYAREALAAHLEVDDLAAAGINVIDHVSLPPAAGAEVDRLGTMRREAESLRRELVSETRRAAKRLRAAGLSVRDVGEILGISAARVAQLERERSVE